MGLDLSFSTFATGFYFFAPDAPMESIHHMGSSPRARISSDSSGYIVGYSKSDAILSMIGVNYHNRDGLIYP